MDNLSILSGIPGGGAGAVDGAEGRHRDGTSYREHGQGADAHVRRVGGGVGHHSPHDQAGNEHGLGGPPKSLPISEPLIEEGEFISQIKRGWASKAKKLGQSSNRREIAEYTTSDGIVRKTRADVINQGNLKSYKKDTFKVNEKSRIKRDWICSCGRRNFENSKFCKNCKLSKAQTFQKQPPPKVSKEITGVLWKSSKDKKEISKVKEVQMRFAKSDNKIITIDELDEALAAESKDKNILVGMNINITNTIVYTKENINDLKWRNVRDMPIKVSNNTIYLGINESEEKNIKVKLSGIPPWVNRDDINEWLSYFCQVKSNIR